VGPKETGNFGEKVACKYLRAKGYEILETNYSKICDSKLRGEIDIIAKKEGVIHFVEVKSQKASAFGGSFLAEDRVNFKKKRQLIKFSQKWLSENNLALDSKWQIDVISVKIDFKNKKAKIRHFENAVF